MATFEGNLIEVPDLAGALQLMGELQALGVFGVRIRIMGGGSDVKNYHFGPGEGSGPPQHDMAAVQQAPAMSMATPPVTPSPRRPTSRGDFSSSSVRTDIENEFDSVVSSTLLGGVAGLRAAFPQ